MAQCPKCGAELSLGAQYCGQCGVRIARPDSTEVPTRLTSVNRIFMASEYVLQKKIAAGLSTVEIKDSAGVLVARGQKMIVPLGAAYSIETPEGVRIGELRGSVALIPNRPSLEIRDANGQEIAIIMMKVAKKPGAGFFSVGITTWVVATPSGEELARINWRKGGHDWTIETPEGAVIAEVHWKWLEVPRLTYQVKILNPIIDPYLVLATVFANPADRA
jgi:uncharacterized protein YxjI/ribosomal protein L40E